MGFELDPKIYYAMLAVGLMLATAGGFHFKPMQVVRMAVLGFVGTICLFSMGGFFANERLIWLSTVLLVSIPLMTLWLSGVSWLVDKVKQRGQKKTTLSE